MNNLCIKLSIIAVSGIMLCGCKKSKPELSKIDSWNKMILENTLNTQGASALEENSGQSADLLSVGISMAVNNEDLAKLIKEGVVPRSVSGNLVTAELPLNKLMKITGYPFVEKVKIFERKHRQFEFPKNVENKLFIGVIDVGFGFNHKNFKNRIFSFWDQQTESITTGTEIQGLNYGVEYGEKDILRNFYEKGYSNIDRHGSFCSLIAGGNNLGWLFDKSDLEPSEFGAVHSPMIIVQTSTDEGDVIDALHYIKKKSQKYKARCVINLSYSNHTGAHNGTSMLTKAIDNLVSDSCLIIASSGNYGNSLIHNSQQLKQNTEVPFFVSKKLPVLNVNHGIYLNSYYDKNRNVTVSLYANDTLVGSAEKGTWENIKLPGGGFVSLINGVSESAGDKTEVLAVIQKQYNPKSDTNILGVWQMKLETDDAGPGRIDTWIGSSVGYNCNFASKKQCSVTSSNLCSASKVLSVGGYYGSGDSLLLDKESSRGQIKERGQIVHAMAPYSLYIPRQNDTIKMSGTSFSAPLLTRTIAKIWEQYPHVKGSDIMEYLNYKAIAFNKENASRYCPAPYETVSWWNIQRHFSQLKE